MDVDCSNDLHKMSIELVIQDETDSLSPTTLSLLVVLVKLVSDLVVYDLRYRVVSAFWIFEFIVVAINVHIQNREPQVVGIINWPDSFFFLAAVPAMR